MTKIRESEDVAFAVDRIIEPWNRACIERNWDALLAMCTDDVVFMPPGADAVTGAAVRPWLDSFPTVTAMSWSVTEIHEDGDTAWLRGPVRQTFEIEGRDERFDGKYCDVMRRDSEGVWQFALIVWNSNQT